MSPRESVRRRLIHETARLLERQGSPRLQMMLIVAATAATAFLASACLLGLGMKLIWVRYVLAASVAYASFFVFVWIWLRWSLAV